MPERPFVAAIPATKSKESWQIEFTTTPAASDLEGLLAVLTFVREIPDSSEAMSREIASSYLQWTLAARGWGPARLISDKEVTPLSGKEPLRIEDTLFGKVDVLGEAEEWGLYLLRIAPGKLIPLHFHKRLAESELVLSPGLHLQGQAVAVGTAIDWPRQWPHAYANPTNQEQVILCIDRPPFDPEDEVLCHEEATQNLATPARFRHIPGVRAFVP